MSELEDEQHAGGCNNSTHRDDESDLLHIDLLKNKGEGVRDVLELGVMHHTGDHQRGHHIDHRTYDQCIQHPPGQIPLRILTFLGGRGDSVKPDVGKKHGRHAL